MASSQLQTNSDSITTHNRVLLIVCFHFNNFEHVPLFEEIYKVFPNKVFYGNSALPSNTDYELLQLGDDSRSQANGFFHYRAMIQAMTSYPDFEGYLFLEDDCTLNVWNLWSKNQTRFG